ncbi:Peptidase C39 domain-containing protein [Sulfidibacter corallicola]|uniref:Peptidase C39 domain-containing protein n=1 Tax=Sulfidibacter corallicola TaxID=2818388 RepID=A0A8A4TKS5_SULCO|nr:cysteine peptidase family C39 domain-containing protein [Sulfidibacter corallicola]QTD50609.1 hypothetical protein J3U87_33915 [Sulfidibacter corallicola]
MNGSFWQPAPMWRHTLVSLALIWVFGLLAVAGETDPAPEEQVPRQKPHSVVPLEQKDGHSCGRLAMSALYRSYGLDPQKARLRERLGTDIPLLPFDEETKGTIQPDFLRVLKQDGFAPEVVRLNQTYHEDRIKAHLNEHHALALIKRKENGNLHWVVLAGYQARNFVIADSLKPQPYLEPVHPFLRENVMSVILVSPQKPQPHTGFWQEHLKGVWDMGAMWFVKYLTEPVTLILVCVAAFVAGRRFRRRYRTP